MENMSAMLRFGWRIFFLAGCSITLPSHPNSQRIFCHDVCVTYCMRKPGIGFSILAWTARIYFFKVTVCTTGAKWYPGYVSHLCIIYQMSGCVKSKLQNAFQLTRCLNSGLFYVWISVHSKLGIIWWQEPKDTWKLFLIRDLCSQWSLCPVLKRLLSGFSGSESKCNNNARRGKGPHFVAASVLKAIIPVM